MASPIAMRKLYAQGACIQNVGHEAQSVPYPEGGTRFIDNEIVPLVQALWDNGYTTLFSCQGTDDVEPWVSLLDEDEANEIAERLGSISSLFFRDHPLENREMIRVWTVIFSDLDEAVKILREGLD